MITERLLLRIYQADTKKIYDYSEAISRVVWSGDYRQPFRTLDVDLFFPVADKTATKMDVALNSTCCFYVGSKEIFRGNCVDVDKDSSDNMLSVTFQDLGNALVRDKKTYNFVNTTPTNIAKKILSESVPKIQAGYLAPTTGGETRLYIGKTGYEIIMDAYTRYAKRNGKKKYMVRANIDKIEIVERGVNTMSIIFEEGKNMIQASYKMGLDNMVNRVIVSDAKGNKVSEKIHQDLYKLYHFFSTEVIQQNDNKKVTPQEITAKFQGIERSCTLTGIGGIEATQGLKVIVRDYHTGLVGTFYVDKDTHTWEGGKYTNKLELNFLNVMDEHEEASEMPKEEKTQSSGNGMGTDWGHGITADMINRVLKGKLAGRGTEYVKWGNAYKVNPLLVALIQRMECGENFDSRLARECNNFGGINGDPEYKQKSGRHTIYPTTEIGIERHFRLLGVVYLHDRKKMSIESILNMYAPSFENNTSGYIGSMKTWYRQFSGRTWNNSLLGVGVASVQEAHANLGSSSSSGGGSSGNAIIEHAINFCIKHLGTRYSQGDRNSYQRNPSNPAAFDCSAMVYYAYADAGRLPKRTGNAWTTAVVRSSYANYGLMYVPLSQAKRGDVLWMPGHLGIYAGNGRALESTPPRSQWCSHRKFTCAYRFKDLQ